MPGRRCRAGWENSSTGGACPRRIARFLEPCLLLLLRGDASHGYNLLEGLGEFGFAPGALDPSIVYRMLREMEVAGWVLSEWDTAGSGPPRRVYHVTPTGEQYLTRWIADLRLTRDEIDRFIGLFEKRQVAEDPSEPPPPDADYGE